MQGRVGLIDGEMVDIPSVRNQVDLYLTDRPAFLANNDTLHVIWAGHNDFINKISQADDVLDLIPLMFGDAFRRSVATNVMSSTLNLIQAGAKDILVILLAPLAGTVPLRLCYDLTLTFSGQKHQL